MKKVALLALTGCPYCEDMKKRIRDLIESGDVEVIQVPESKFGVEIVKKLGIREFPSFVAIEEMKEKKKVCLINDKFEETEKCALVEEKR